MVEELVCRYLLNRGEASGRQIADQLRLPFRLIDPILNRLKSEQMTVYRGANSVNDYTHSLTDQGRDRARRYNLAAQPTMAPRLYNWKSIARLLSCSRSKGRTLKLRN